MFNLRSGHTEILGVGGYLPSTVVKTSEVLSDIRPDQYGIESDFIERTMGISESRFSDPGLYPSDLATFAAEDMFDRCEVSPNDVGMIIFCGMDRDNNEPSTAHRVQKKLGVRESVVFDVANACHGFMDGLNIIDSFISSGAIDYGLVVTGEQPSHLTKRLAERLKNGMSQRDFRVRIGALTTGDCGGAMLIGRKRDKGIEMTQSLSKGEFADLCYYRQTPTGDIEGQLIMGPLQANAIRMHHKIYEKSMDYLNWEPDDIDYLVTHQVGNRLFERFSKIFQVSADRMTKTFPMLGNLITGTIPINLWQLERRGALCGKQVFLACSGSGLSISQWGINF